MSDKVRVLFKIPQSHPKWSKLARPVEIPLEEYIQIRMDEQAGSKDYMASYVTQKYLKGDDVSADEIEMVTAPGNYIHTFELDRLIEQGINPLDRMNQPDNDDDDDYFSIPKGYDDDDDEDHDNKNSSIKEISGTSSHSNEKKDIQKALLLIGIGVAIFAILFIIAFT